MIALEDLLAKQACSELMMAYCTPLDERNVERFLALFEPLPTLRKTSEPTYVSVGHVDHKLSVYRRRINIE